MSNNLGCNWRFVHTNGSGDVLYDSGWKPNQMGSEGIEQMYDIYFRGKSTVPSKFQIGLLKSAPNKSSTVASLSEVTGTGYARKDVERSNTGFPTLALDGGDMQVTSKEVTFKNTGSTAWAGATHGFMSAVTSGGDKFVGWNSLIVSRVLQPNDELHVMIQLKGQQP